MSRYCDRLPNRHRYDGSRERQRNHEKGRQKSRSRSGSHERVSKYKGRSHTNFSRTSSHDHNSFQRSKSPNDLKSHRKNKVFEKKHDTFYQREHKERREWDVEKQRSWRDPDSKKKFEWGKPSKAEDLAKQNNTEEQKPKEKPNFETTGKLVEDTNKFNGVVIKYNEPPKACKPKIRWRLYPFKNNESLPTLYVHRQSAYLIGKDRRIVDLAVDHPSCSKQHAVLQYRQVSVKTPDGSRTIRRIKPYIIDLESANGTYLNNQKIEPRKYYELIEKDVLKFGFSTREYVMLHEHSVDDEKEVDSESNQHETESESEVGENHTERKFTTKIKEEPSSDNEGK